MIGFADPYGILKLVAKQELKDEEEKDFFFEQQPPIKTPPSIHGLKLFYHTLNKFFQWR